jgi:tetratricopeptide (TPR) repeat protein
MQAILATENPTEADTARLNEAASVALQAANEAILIRGNDARNWSVRGDAFTLLAAIGYEDAGARAIADYNEARARDPQNPYYDFQAAGLAVAAGNEEEARTKIGEALARKSNYTDALVFLSQLEIARGNIKEAIKTTESLLVFEPNNPGRYYQLGVLYGADNNAAAAISAFTNALTLNPQYANARYMRALQVLAQGDQATATAELEMVRDMNPDNASVSELIEKIKRGEVTTNTGTPAAVTEPEAVTRDGEAVTTDTDPNSPLVSPVNTVPENASSTRAE